MSRCRHELNQPPPSPEGEQEKARFQQQHEARNQELEAERTKRRQIAEQHARPSSL